MVYWIWSLECDRSLIVRDVDEGVFESFLLTADCGPLDMLIRTSGETRLSDFLVWQVFEFFVAYNPSLVIVN